MENRNLQLAPLGLAAGAGAILHFGLLTFEHPLIIATFISPQSPPPGWNNILVAHLVINVTVGILYALSARPLPDHKNAAFGGGAAVAIANSLCTLMGTVVVLSTSLSALTRQLTSSALGYGWLMSSVLAFAILTGFLAAPLGMIGGIMATTIRRYPFPGKS